MARAKKKKPKLPVEYVYAGAGFVLGTLFSAFIFLVLVTYPAWENGLLSNASYGLRVGVDAVFNWGRKEAYGRVESVTNGAMVLVSTRSGITRVYNLRFDEQTKFYMFAPDNELSEVILSPESIQPGEYASITTEEPVGSKKEQKIISLLVM